jgi:hypothetical protein
MRALAFRSGEHVAIPVACDLIGLARGDIDEIRAALAPRDIAPDALIIASSHTHSGPDTLGLWGPDALTSGVHAEDQALLELATAARADPVPNLFLPRCTTCCCAAPSLRWQHSMGGSIEGGLRC